MSRNALEGLQQKKTFHQKALMPSQQFVEIFWALFQTLLKLKRCIPSVYQNVYILDVKRYSIASSSSFNYSKDELWMFLKAIDSLQFFLAMGIHLVCLLRLNVPVDLTCFKSWVLISGNFSSWNSLQWLTEYCLSLDSTTTVIMLSILSRTRNSWCTSLSSISTPSCLYTQTSFPHLIIEKSIHLYNLLTMTFFFLQTTDLTLKGPFFTETTKLRDRPIPSSGNIVQRVPPFMFPFLNVTYKTERFKNKRFFLFPVGEKWFPILIEHERHPLGVSKLFSEFSKNTSCACFKNFALFEPQI